MSNVAKTGGSEPNNATTANRFGQSVESQAQIADAALLGSPAAAPGERMNIYRLVPTAAADDPRWDNSPYQGERVVAARTSGDARIVAASAETDFQQTDAAPAADVTTSHASAFRSDKLYTVVEIDRDRADVARGVLDESAMAGVIKPDGH